MGEIADSLISGEFDCITGEYLGDALAIQELMYVRRMGMYHLLERNHQARRMYVLPTCAKIEASTTAKR